MNFRLLEAFRAVMASGDGLVGDVLASRGAHLLHIAKN
jgi:hypothetical protein